jgi:hypothetical protein
LKPAAVMFYITGVVVFIQVVTGGLRVFGFIDESTHITAGLLTFVLALIALIVVAVSKPRYRPAIGNAGGVVVLVAIQGFLGFAFLDTNNFAIIMVHYVNALLIFGAAIGLVFNAMRMDRMQPAAPAVTQ